MGMWLIRQKEKVGMIQLKYQNQNLFQRTLLELRALRWRPWRMEALRTVRRKSHKWNPARLCYLSGKKPRLQYLLLRLFVHPLGKRPKVDAPHKRYANLSNVMKLSQRRNVPTRRVV
jgi:hypothetical protein